MTPQLPVEMLDLIFSHLCVDADPDRWKDDQAKLSTMANVARSSRTFNRTVRQYLYRTLDFRRFGSQFRWIRLLQSLSKAPSNSDYVQQIYAESRVFRFDGHSEKDTPEEFLSMQSALQALVDTTFDTRWKTYRLRRRIRDALLIGSGPAGAALLLVLCVNVRVFSYRSDNDINDWLMMCIIQDAELTSKPAIALAAKPLQHLTEFNIDVESEAGPQTLGALDDILRIPTLETFRGCGVAHSGYSHFGRALSSQVTRVCLRQAAVDAYGISSLLAACPFLTALSIEMAMPTFFNHLNIPRMGEVFRKSGTCLRNLSLIPAAEAHLGDESRHPDAGIGSLASLTSLRSLTSSCTILFGSVEDYTAEYPRLVEMLPTSLRTLEIIDDDAEEDPDFLDEGLWDMMRDERFKELGTIGVKRRAAFTRHAHEIGWDDSERDQSWVVLKRK